jgi:flagellar protein FliL
MAELLVNPEEKKLSKKNIILVIVLALLLVLSGMGAGYYFFARNGDAKQVANEHPVESKATIYVDMTEPMIVNFPKGLDAGFVQLSVSFLVNSEETVASLKKHEPMLRNNLMMKINAQNPQQLKTRAGKEALRVIMLNEANQVLAKMAGGGRISEVFFTAFVMQ